VKIEGCHSAPYYLYLLHEKIAFGITIENHFFQKVGN
jgi:hypothetical protein